MTALRRIALLCLSMLALAGCNDEEAFAPIRDRYVEQLRQLFRIVRGETPLDESLYDHDLTVHETVLAASGITPSSAR